MNEETYVAPDVVAWPLVNGDKVTTNGVMEEALGLQPFMCGWNAEGFYTHTKQELIQHMETIDWERVAFVNSRFDIKATGYVAISSNEKCWVTERRFVRLMRLCKKGLSKESFDREVETALKIGSMGYGSGSL